MTEPSLYILLKHIITFVAGPILAFGAYMMKKTINRIDKHEDELKDLDKKQAVQSSQLSDVKEDVHQINTKLDKILDKLTK